MFWPDGNAIDATWGTLARNKDNAWFQRMATWQIAHNMNTVLFLTYNRDPRCLVNPFTRTYGPDINWTELQKWAVRLEGGKKPDLFLVPCLFCDDDRETAGNIAFQDYYIPLICVGLDPYIKAVCIGLEMNECYSTASMERIIGVCKQWTKKPIVVHMRWNHKDRLPRGLDGLIYEHPWHPNYGDKHSADEVASIGADVIAKSGLPVWFNEYNTNVNGQRIREQTRALAALPGCVGVGGVL